MTLNASLDRFFQCTDDLKDLLTAEKLIAHLARDGFKILPAEEVEDFLAWREVAG